MVKITKAQLARWRKYESEHSKSVVRQEVIVKQHVAEHGIHYYPALIRMENRLRKKYG